MRLVTAISVFFKILGSGEFAEQVRRLASGEKLVDAKSPAPKAAERKPRPEPPARNDAVSLVAALQREARFVDMVMEPLTDYSDAQIGAAARDVLADCGKTLERMFAVQPLVEADEGSELETPAELDANQFRLTGNVSGDPPFKGRVVHHGWKATRCELPKWSGSKSSALIVAPVELEVG